MAKIPTKEEYRKVWSNMPWRDRREILRAVNRGEAMRLRRKARLAVATARQQQRYWKFAWMFAPVVALVLTPNWIAVATNAVVLSAITGAFAWWRHGRAVKAERANLDRLAR